MHSVDDDTKWQAVAKQTPQLHSHVQTFPETYRGVRWYIFRNELTGQHLRLNQQAYNFAARLDGKNTIESIVDALNDAPSGNGIGNDEALHLLDQLFAMGLTKHESPTSAAEVSARTKHNKVSRIRRTLMSPLSVRVPLIDPDKFLNKAMPLVKPLFSTISLILWLGLLVFSLLMATTHSQAISAALNPSILAPNNLVLMLIIFIAIKAVHEFAHAFAVKNWGGEVHEMGITFLVLAPVPYVDASAAWAFRGKYKRIIVSAIGIMVELFIASIAFLIWLSVEPGTLKDAAFNAVLIGGVSTLLFNANPLLRFDGYYILQDLVEIPNLYTRSGRFYTYMVQRFLYGQREIQSPATTTGETVWFTFYGLGAFIYRNILLLTIVFFLVEEYLFIGVALGSWAILMQVVLPLVRMSVYLSVSPKLKGNRFRAITTTILLTGIITMLMFSVPAPRTTQTEGVVWVSEQAQIYTDATGFVETLFIESGEYVAADTPILQMRSPVLNAQIKKLQARKRELHMVENAEFIETTGRSKNTLAELQTVEMKLALLQEQNEGLLVRSQLAGTFILPKRESIQGIYLQQGELIGYIFEPSNLIIKSIVAQSDIGLVRQHIDNIEIRLAGRLREPLQASVHRETPSGTRHLPSRALGTSGGGRIAITLHDEQGTTATEGVFQLELKTTKPLNTPRVGERAYVRIEHSPEPLGKQWVHGFRQLILGRLPV